MSERKPTSKFSKVISNGHPVDIMINEIYALINPFIPAPLIKIIENKGFETFTMKKSIELFNTYVRIWLENLTVTNNKSFLLNNRSFFAASFVFIP